MPLLSAAFQTLGAAALVTLLGRLPTAASQVCLADGKGCSAEQAVELPTPGAPWAQSFKPQVFQYDALVDGNATAHREFMTSLLTDGLVLVNGVPGGAAHPTWKLIDAAIQPTLAVNNSVWDAGGWEANPEIDLFNYDLPMVYSNRTGALAHPNYGGNVLLVPHTDNFYFNVSTRVKVIHCYSVAGEELPMNTFTDGFHLLNLLSDSEREVLKQQEVKGFWQSSGASNYTFTSRRYTIDRDSRGRQRVALNKSTRDEENTDFSPEGKKALEHLDTLALDPENSMEMAMGPGVAAFMDNWRVLHGRRGGQVNSRAISGADVADQAVWKRWQELASLA